MAGYLFAVPTYRSLWSQGYYDGRTSDGTDGGPGQHQHRPLSQCHGGHSPWTTAPDCAAQSLLLDTDTPTDLFRSKLSTSEIQSRAISSLPDDLLANIPDDTSSYSLFEGFQVSQDDRESRKSHRRRDSKGNKLLKEGEAGNALPSSSEGLKKERGSLSHRLEMMGVRKNMCSSEIHEIDNKIANLHNMRKIVLDRLAGLEMDEAGLENERGCKPIF